MLSLNFQYSYTLITAYNHMKLYDFQGVYFILFFFLICKTLKFVFKFRTNRKQKRGFIRHRAHT